MPKQCPKCHREFEMETEFCPACGAPMNPEAFRISEKRKEENGILLPVKWYKFLIWFSLPLSLIIACVNLFNIHQLISRLDMAQYAVEAGQEMVYGLYLELIVQALLIPLILTAEIFLVKKKWRGVQILLSSYALNMLYAVSVIILFLRLSMSIMEPAFALAQALLMFILNRVYFRKRKAMFRA